MARDDQDWHQASASLLTKLFTLAASGFRPLSCLAAHGTIPSRLLLEGMLPGLSLAHTYWSVVSLNENAQALLQCTDLPSWALRHQFGIDVQNSQASGPK